MFWVSVSFFGFEFVFDVFRSCCVQGMVFIRFYSSFIFNVIGIVILVFLKVVWVLTPLCSVLFFGGLGFEFVFDVFGFLGFQGMVYAGVLQWFNKNNLIT